MNQKNVNTRISKKMTILLFIFVVFSGRFQGCLAQSTRSASSPATVNRLSSSVVFPLTGNVYPLGYYSASLDIGNPPKIFDLDFDTGSDLTWVQCDAPCVGCTKPIDSLYKPKKNIVTCQDSLCESVQTPGENKCESATKQCDYEVVYADDGSSLGVLVSDIFPLQLTNGSVIRPRLTFGCGYNQEIPALAPPTAGVLGLGNGKVSLVSQLHAMGLTADVRGHCLSRQGGGFAFIGDNVVPSSGTTWTPMSPSFEGYYSSGPAEVYFGGKPSGIKGLQVVFDTGSSYTYFSSQVYHNVLNLIREDVKRKPLKDASEDNVLPVCWKGGKPFKSISDVKGYFKPLALRFTNLKNVEMQLPPESYLIISDKGNACLGILNGTEVGLGKINVLGDIALQDKMVIYDNAKQQIGWVSTNCNQLPIMGWDHNEDISQRSTGIIGILKGQCPLFHESKRSNLQVYLGMY